MTENTHAQVRPAMTAQIETPPADFPIPADWPRPVTATRDGDTVNLVIVFDSERTLGEGLEECGAGCGRALATLAEMAAGLCAFCSTQSLPRGLASR